MPTSYLVTGVSNGLGFEFLRQLSEKPDTVVIGLSRNKQATEETVAKELNRQNIHILHGDLHNVDSLKVAVKRTSEITGGSLDYVIANATHNPKATSYDAIGTLYEENAVALERDLVDCFRANVIGNVHLFGLLMPLILQGRAKKVISLSTGMADIEAIRNNNIQNGVPYATSKAASHVIVAKFHAQYSKDGVLFMSISPGFVDTPANVPETEEQALKMKLMLDAFMKLNPDWTGPLTPAASVSAVMHVVEKSSVEAGDGGSFVSHHGNKEWL